MKRSSRVDRVVAAMFVLVLIAVAPRLAASQDTPQFDRSLVKVTVVSKKQLGGQIEVYFIKKAPDPILFRMSQQCVADYTKQYKAAACFAFRSAADLAYARIDRINGGMERLCWRARFMVSLAGTTSGEESNGTIYGVTGCPGGE